MRLTFPLPGPGIWAILRKDAFLFWPLVIADVAGQVILAISLFAAEQTNDDNVGLKSLAALVALGAGLASALLIVFSVQQEAISSDDQDWLVRPIRRIDLLVAKLLIVVLSIHLPMFLISLVRGVADGYTMGEAAVPSLMSSLQVAALYSLPLMAVSAMTKNASELLVLSLALMLGLTLIQLIAPGIASLFFGILDYDAVGNASPISWAWRALGHTLLLLITFVVLILQYFMRRTTLARIMFVGGMLSYTLARWLPWEYGFAIQQRISANSGAANSISISFDSTALRQVASPPGTYGASSTQKLPGGEPTSVGTRDTVPMFVPLRVSALSEGVVLHVDKLVVRFIGADGAVLYRVTSQSNNIRPSNADAASTTFFQAVDIPSAVLGKIADHAITVTLDYSLTSLRRRVQPLVPVMGGEIRVPNAGHCRTEVADGGGAVELRCHAAGRLPSCYSVAFVFERSDQRSAEKVFCTPDYAPALLRYSLIAFDYSSVRVPVSEPTTSASINSLISSDMRLEMSVYEPEVHFARHITIPNRKVRDWLAVSRAPNIAATVSVVPAIAAYDSYGSKESER